MLLTSWAPGIGLPGKPLRPPVPLEGSPLLERLLFEHPLLLGGPLVVVGVATLFVMNARGDLKRGLLIAGGLLALAGGVFALAMLVRTTHESIKQATRHLIAAVATADVTAADPLLTDDIEIRYQGFASPDKPGVLAAIDRNMRPGGLLHVSAWSIAETQTALDGPDLARSQVLVRATVASQSLPVSAWVLLKWDRGPDDQWRCFAVEPIDVD